MKPSGVLRRVLRCGPCRERRAQWEFAATVAVCVAASVLFSGARLGSRTLLEQRALALAAFFAAFLVEITIHELGHVVFGLLAGLRKPQVRVGSGPAVAQGRIGSFTYDIRILPTSGRCEFGFRPDQGVWWRMALMLAGGVPSSAAVTAVGWWFRGQGAFPVGLLAAGGLGLCRFLPRRPAAGIPSESDGTALVSLLRLRRWVGDDERAVGGPLQEVLALFKAGRFEDAETAAAGHLADLPGSINLAIEHASAVAFLRPEEARDLILDVLKHPAATGPSLFRSRALTVLALCDATSGDPGLRAEAVAAIEEARWIAIDPPITSWVRALVLVETGRAEEVIARARSLLFTNERGPAFAACVLALGHLRLGDLGAARAHLADARTCLPPAIALLRRIEAEVAAATTGNGTEDGSPEERAS